MKKIIFLGFIFVFLLQNNALSLELKKTIRSEYIMGTIFTILVYSEDDKLTEKGINEAFKEIRKYDSILSNYKNDSEINTVLKDAYKKPIKISNELYDVINDCLFFSKITDGKFNITIEPLVKLWGFKNKNFKKPTLDQINKVKKDIGYKNIILDPKYHTLYIKNKADALSTSFLLIDEKKQNEINKKVKIDYFVVF